jgi:exonuclease III
VRDHSGKSNTELFTAFIQTTTPDILAISEHGLKDDEITQCTLKGYTVVTHFCRKKHKGGRTAIYRYKKLLQSKPLK